MTTTLDHAPQQTTKSSHWQQNQQLQWLRQRVLSWSSDNLNTGWEDVIVAQGAADIGIATNDEAMIDWAATWLDHQLDAGIEVVADGFIGASEQVSGVKLYNYCGNWGFAFALAAILPARPEQRYQDAIIHIADYIAKHSLRGDDGVILHGGFIDTVWVDTLYYSAPVFAAAYQVTDNPDYLNAAIDQCVLHAKHLRDEHTGLYHHDADPRTMVRTTQYWGRGNGWIIAALADTLAVCPSDHPRYHELFLLYRSIAESLLGYQHSNGMWRVALENQDSYLETSATSMIGYGLARGVAEGWLEDLAAHALRRAMNELQSWITGPGNWRHPAGSLLGSQYPSGRGDWDHLKLTSFGENSYTTGFALRFAAAYERATTPELRSVRVKGD